MREIARRLYYSLRWGELGKYLFISSSIPGWTRGDEAVALAECSRNLPSGAIIVEIGSFLGCSTVLLAGARKISGSGKVICIDPFDLSGDAYSVPFYQSISSSLNGSIRESFERNIQAAGLMEWISIRQGKEDEIAKVWKDPVDLLFLDADHSYDVVSKTFATWTAFMKPGGILAVHNAINDTPDESHRGSMRLVGEKIHSPQWDQIRLIGTTMFARKVANG